ncbi:hypothetical protein vseg_018212 [Gypsophila vaccaria]
MEVIIVSSETIKPSSPTPSHLQKMTLSFIDQQTAPLTVPALLFYRAPPSGAAPLDIARLKTALSETLTSFYPLAGRYNTWGTTQCNDEGVPFVESRVSCPISDVIFSPTSWNVDLLSLYPPGENLQRSGIHLAIQVNVFACGGFAIGWYHTHKVTDGVSTATFFRHWAALVTERYNDAALSKPDFDSCVTFFPPLIGEDKPVTPESNEAKNNPFFSSRNVVRSFVFKNEAIAKLKGNSVSEQLPNPSRFEAVSGFLWKQMLLADHEGQSMLSAVVDIRPRTDPPMPKTSIGNLLETAFVKAKKQATLPELVSEIHVAITKMKEIVAKYQTQDIKEAKEKHWQNFINTFIECKGKDVYILTSWCKSAGYNDVDFGFGGPVWTVPVDNKAKTSNNLRNTIVLTEFNGSDENGFEAWLFLDEERMKFLECSQEFLAYAFPSF